MIDDFIEDLRNQTAGNGIGAGLIDVATQTMQPASVAIWTAEEGTDRQ